MKTKVALFEVSDFVSKSKQYSGIGLGYIKSYLNKKSTNFEVKIFQDNILKEIVLYKPDIIGISSVSYFYENAILIARILKKELPDAKLIIGGIHITTQPEDFNVIFDCGILGEGEIVFERISNLIHFNNFNFSNLEKLNGVVYFKGKRLVIKNNKNDLKNIDNIGSIDRDDYLDPYYSYLISSRGCIHNCLFCGNVGFWKKQQVRLHSAEYLYREIKEIYKRGISTITIVDEMFFLDLKRLKRLEKLLKEGSLLNKIKFICYLKQSTFNNSQSLILKKLNIKEVWMELDTINYKGENEKEKTKEIINFLASTGIKTNLIATINNKNESEKDIVDLQKTIEHCLGSIRNLVLKANPVFPRTVNFDFYKNKIGVIDWIFINRDLFLLFNKNIYINQKSLDLNKNALVSLINYVYLINKRKSSVLKNKIDFFLKNKNKKEFIFNKLINFIYYKTHLIKNPASFKEISIRLTNNCNLNCDFCINKKYRSNSLRKENFSYLDLHKILSYCVKNNVKVYLSGGEPTLNSDLFKIIKLLRLNNLYVYMYSNGYLLDKIYEKLKLSSLNNLTISVDHFEANLHDRGRGKMGLFKKIISSLNYIEKDLFKNIEINIACVINSKNYLDLLSIYSYFNSFKFIKNIHFQPLSFIPKKVQQKINSFSKFKLNYADGQFINKDQYFNFEQVKGLYNEFFKIKKYAKNNILKPQGIANNKTFLNSYYLGKNISNTSRCRGAFEHVHILGNDISLWCGYKIGDLKNDYFLDDLFKRKNLKDFQEYILNKKIPYCFRCTKIDIKF